MIEHVTDLLGAYVDGELHGLRLRQVEEHLARCAGCRKELADLRSLSSLLQNSVPMEAFTPADQFAANMVLRLSAQIGKDEVTVAGGGLRSAPEAAELALVAGSRRGPGRMGIRPGHLHPGFVLVHS